MGIESAFEILNSTAKLNILMKLLFKGLISTLVAIPLLVVLIYIVVTDGQPTVMPEVGELNHQNVKRIKELIKQNYPRRFTRRHFKIVNIRQDDFNLMLNYGMQRFLSGASKLDLVQNRAEISASIRIPDAYPGAWLNVRAVLSSENDPELEVAALRLGSLPIPSWLIQPLITRVHMWGQERHPEYKELVETVKSLRFEKEKLFIVYEWRPQLLKRIQAKGEELLLPKVQRDRLIAYHNHMAKHTRRFHGKKLGLSALLRPMFQFAVERTKQSGDAIAENRALLLTLSVYANGSNMRHVLSHQKGQRILYAGYPRIMLNQRRDLMQHYLVSSGLTVSAGLGIADALGLAKEISDSIGGSGFSFADLLADRAGVKFAELATSDESTARALQTYMSREQLSEKDFMPSTIKLPEGLNEKEFKRRYRQVGSPEYNQIKTIIEQRINGCDVFKRYARA